MKKFIIAMTKVAIFTYLILSLVVIVKLRTSETSNQPAKLSASENLQDFIEEPTFDTEKNDIEAATPDVKLAMTDISVIVANEGTPENFYEGIVKTLNRIPEGAKNALINEGWSIRVVDHDLASEVYAYYPVNAYTNYSTKTIAFRATDARFDIAKIVHEIGRVLYTMNGLDNAELDAVYAAEMGSFAEMWQINPMDVATKREYWAECFECCVLAPADFAESCPETRRFMESVFSN